jgi:hypothetical protein
VQALGYFGLNDKIVTFFFVVQKVFSWVQVMAISFQQLRGTHDLLRVGYVLAMTVSL